MAATFTPEQLANFRIYEQVRASGAYNMFDPRARAATGMTEDEYVFCMEHYGELEEASKKKGS